MFMFTTPSCKINGVTSPSVESYGLYKLVTITVHKQDIYTYLIIACISTQQITLLT